MAEIKTFHYDPPTQRYVERAITKDLGVNEVLIRTTHSGICYTDVHAKRKGCGLGHEGVGFVQNIGAGVTHLCEGDRVGWGWLNDSCGHCTECVSGYRPYCADAAGFAFSSLDQGSLSSHRVINAAFAYKIPAEIPSSHAAPLMCAGASVYEALDAAGTKAHHRVGVVGIGGLGHMGLLFAKAWGCGVTAISSKPHKAQDVFELGADELRVLDSPERRLSPGSQDLSRVSHDPEPRNIDVLLLTSNAVPSLEPLFPLLARRATIVLMTIQQEPLQIPYMPLVLPGHRLIASTEASRENHVRMLQFVARNKVKPWVQEWKMSEEGIREAFKCLEEGDIRYRGVLVRVEDAK